MKLTSDTIAKVASALVKAQSEMSNAVKDARNPFFKNTYANLNSVREACLPALNKYGISAVQPTVVVDGKKYVQTLLLHESGEFISSLTEILTAKENDAQQQGGGITYARRYGLQALVNLGDTDNDGETAVGRNTIPEKVTATKQDQPAAKAPASSSFRRPAVVVASKEEDF